MYDRKGPDFNSDFLGWGLLCMQHAWVVPTKSEGYRFGDVCLSAHLWETISLYPLVRLDGIKRLSIEIVQESFLVFLSPHPPTLIMGYSNQPGVHRSCSLHNFKTDCCSLAE